MKLREKILGILNETPKTGYEIAQAIHEQYPSKISFIHRWHFDMPGMGSLYLELDRLDDKIKREYINGRYRYSKI